MNDLHLVKTDRAVPRFALSIREASKSLGLSEGAFRGLLPQIPQLRAGRRVVIPVDSFRKWLAAQSQSICADASLWKGAGDEQT